MSRAMPQKCEHGRIMSWGDFGGSGSKPEDCPECEKGFEVTDRILWNSGREEVDEIVVRGVDLHLEQMSDQCWWLSIRRGDHQLAVNFFTLSRRSMTVTYEDLGAGKPWPWAKDEEHGAP